MVYDRQVRYLDYFENGQRIRGCGFVKLELREERLRLEMALRGLEGMDSPRREVILCSGGKENTIGYISIDRGAGEFRYESRLQEQSGLPERICIHAGDDREISGRFSEKWQKQDKAVRTEMAAGIEKKVAVGKAVAIEKAVAMEKKFLQEELAAAQKGEREHEKLKEGGGVKEEEAERTARLETGSREAQAAPQEEEKTLEKPSMRLLEDKWLQICSIYPHIRPFQDEREYLSIGPADFLLFQEKSYRQVNNSFMLHGFYNYKHLILTRVERRGEILYYIGVPGNFYEREKQVALMFGFESFECAEEPAQTGDFGYYMMRTEL